MSPERLRQRVTGVPLWVWVLLAFVGGVVLARLPTTWHQFQRLDGTTILSTLIGTSVPAAAGYGFAKASAEAGARALHRVQLEEEDDYVARTQAQRRNQDRERRGQWDRLRDALTPIPGAATVQPNGTLEDYFRAIDILGEHLDGFASLYPDVEHAQTVIEGLNGNRERRISVLGTIRTRIRDYQDGLNRSHDETVAHSQLTNAERALKAPDLVHALHLIATYMADHQGTGDSFDGAYTAAGATLAHQVGAIANDDRHATRLLATIDQLLDDPTKPFEGL